MKEKGMKKTVSSIVSDVTVTDKLPNFDDKLGLHYIPYDMRMLSRSGPEDSNYVRRYSIFRDDVQELDVAQFLDAGFDVGIFPDENEGEFVERLTNIALEHFVNPTNVAMLDRVNGGVETWVAYNKEHVKFHRTGQRVALTFDVQPIIATRLTGMALNNYRKLVKDKDGA
jgi:hypothetical protein